ncbi:MULTISPECIES: N-acyl homoserine lactonase family protein [unclassified Pseudonocardia]|uniref:N-acyl homoserine lactonase family protein n=1 Tax=unclassified Pseudonocardia TaxID=2619320 RepID=UPI0007615095|nr:MULTISPECIES: N-acyl homoserine lactonase family protein [unclassified Pseudonocardia]
MGGLTLTWLDLGELTNDPGLALAGGGMVTSADPVQRDPLCVQSMSAYVLEHPRLGPILYELGVAPNRDEVWPPEAHALAAPSRYETEHHLDHALADAGYGVGDIQAVIASHLHLDHAGGLEVFRGTDVPVYVHADELKNAFFAVATGEDLGPYLPHYIDHTFNWKPIHGESWEFADGITLHRAQGHTPGLLMLEAEMVNSGKFLLTSDQFPLEQNFAEPRPQGWIQRDHAAWWRSLRWTESFVNRTGARLVYGHDAADFAVLKRERRYD